MSASDSIEYEYDRRIMYTGHWYALLSVFTVTGSTGKVNKLIKLLSNGLRSETREFNFE
jgi:hypothetical protein